MPKLKFNPAEHSLILSADIKATYPEVARLVLDTGASYVVLPWKMVTGIGLKIDPKRTIQITTASAVETVPKIVVPEISVLGKSAKNVEAIVKDLPSDSPADGLLGLSFLKHFKLSIDFPRGILNLDS